LSLKHRLLKTSRVALEQLVAEPFILYPARPRPSYADHVLQLFRAHGFGLSNVIDVNEMQTAIRLVAAGVGVTLVPDSVQRLKRDDVVYRKLKNKNVTSPVIMNYRKDDVSVDLVRLKILLKAQTSGVNTEHD
jgi:DNA-binding transcriptional LysR family regulator